MAIAIKQLKGVGTAGQVLTSNGTSAAPTMQDPATGGTPADGMLFVPEHPHFGWGSGFPSDAVQRGYSFKVPGAMSFDTIEFDYNTGSHDCCVAIYQATDGGEGTANLIAYGVRTAAGRPFTLNATCSLVAGKAYLVWGCDNAGADFNAFNFLSVSGDGAVPVWDDSAVPLPLTTFELTAAYAVPPPSTLGMGTAVFSDTAMVVARGYTA